MANKETLRKIIKEAKRDEERRRDPRYLGVMGFLVAKGFLRTNQNIPMTPNKHIRIEDAIWAGRFVEPRILEVLPAAVLRLKRHFDFHPGVHPELEKAVENLRLNADQGEAFCGVPFEKLKQWADYSLKDRRVKTRAEKKIPKTFRLDPKALKRLQELAQDAQCTETEILERRILDA